MFGGQQNRQFLHVLLDQRLESKHDTRPTLRVHRRPADLRLYRLLHGVIDFGSGGQGHTRLYLAGIGVVNIAEAA